jgi:GT2 family glycosyltransferase
MKYKLICLTPFHNEEKNLKRFLKENSKFVDGFIFLDDASTDSSLKLVKDNPKTIKLLKKSNRKNFNDKQNRNILLKEASKTNSEWFIFLDADEVLDKHYLNDFKKLLDTNYEIYWLRLVHLWDSIKTYRCDYPESLNGVQYKARLFRKKENMYLDTNNRLHMRLVPYTGKEKRADVLIKHYANVYKKNRIKRFENYTKLYDKKLQNQISYSHFLDDEIDLCNILDLYD